MIHKGVREHPPTAPGGLVSATSYLLCSNGSCWSHHLSLAELGTYTKEQCITCSAQVKGPMLLFSRTVELQPPYSGDFN